MSPSPIDSVIFAPGSNTPILRTTILGAVSLLRVISFSRIGGVPVVGSWIVSTTVVWLSDTKEAWLGGSRGTVEQQHSTCNRG